jgi:hypothetical protein
MKYGVVGKRYSCIYFIMHMGVATLFRCGYNDSNKYQTVPMGRHVILDVVIVYSY